MEKKHIIIVAVLLIIVAVVSFNFGKITGQAAREAIETAEAEEQIPAEETTTEVAGEEQAVSEEPTKGGEII